MKFRKMKQGQKLWQVRTIAGREVARPVEVAEVVNDAHWQGVRLDVPGGRPVWLSPAQAEALLEQAPENIPGG